MRFVNTCKTAYETLVLSFKSDPQITVLVACMTFIQAGVIALIALSQRWVIDSAYIGEYNKLLIAVALGAWAYGMQLIGHRFSHNYKNDLSNRIHFAVEQEITEMTSGIPTITHLENGEYVNKIALLKRGTLALANTGWALVQSLSSLLSIIFSVWLLARVDPFFTSLPLMGFLILVFSNMAKRFRRNALENNVEILRREGSLHDIYLDPVKSKEIWISGNGKKMSNIASQLWTKALNIEAKAIFQGLLTEMTSWLVFYLLFGCVLVKLAIDYDADNFHPGDLVLLISLVGQLQRQLNEGVEAMSQVADGGLATTHYHWLRRLAENKNEKIISLGKERNRGIEFKDVSFKYKNNNHDILKNINLHIPWGVSIGIVGVNGAGKTSLVKLLSGLQYPTVGDIYIDGNNLRDIDLDEWHSRCTCTFQDFVQLHSMLRESVGIGDLRRINDDEHIIKSINMTRFDTRSGDISHHLDTQLGDTFNGVNLSYGQWQRVAIARGLMRDDAKIAILDEPTASLDPLTESKIFELFIKRTHKIKRNGGIVILVSHRFSATNLADIIFVLDNASIIEIGSHQELLSMNGKYASLFKLQSDAYMRM